MQGPDPNHGRQQPARRHRGVGVPIKPIGHAGAATRQLLCLLGVVGFIHARPASAQWIAPGPGIQDSPRQGYESETVQAGGKGAYHYSRIGALRCAPGEAIVGADFSDAGMLNGIRLHCAAVSCAGATCGWDSGSLHDGASIGVSPPAGGRDCPSDSAAAGYGANIINDAPGSVVLQCARLAGAAVAVGGTQLYPVIWPGAEGTAIPRPGPGAMGQGSVTAESAYRDTLAYAPQAYGSVLARSNYYAVMNSILQGAPGTADIKFFDAASQVTNGNHVGAIETVAGLLLHRYEAFAILRTVNQRLFEGNMRVLQNLLIAGRPYGDPTSRPSAPPAGVFMPVRGRCPDYAATAISAGVLEDGTIQALSLYCGQALSLYRDHVARAAIAQDSSCRPTYPAMRFDLAMVDYEQSTVEDVLTGDPRVRGLLPNAATDIDRDLNFNGDSIRPAGGLVLGLFGLFDKQPFSWARAYLGRTDLSFLRRGDRVAIGKALIFELHGCTAADYLFYMRAHR